MRKRLPWSLTGRWWATVSGSSLIPTVIAIAMLYGRGGIIAGIALAALYTLWLGWLTLPERYDREALERVLSALPTHLGLSQAADVRCAVYVPVDRQGGEWVVSVTDYKPSGPSLAGYRLSSSKGIVGLAYRTGQTHLEILADPRFNNARDFQDYMVNRYGFTRKEAQALPTDRRAYLASPVRASGNIVLGVIFMEAAQADAFDDPTLAARVEALASFFHELLLLKGG